MKDSTKEILIGSGVLFGLAVFVSAIFYIIGYCHGEAFAENSMWHEAVKCGAAIEEVVDHKIVYRWREYHDEGYNVEEQ